ncbi:MAG: hypothetical protein U1E27_12665 [Kiritimatiellia bacterium]|nr:hypothetical protein [Kiritimatiellia bacterium]
MKPDLIAPLSGTGYAKMKESRRQLTFRLLVGSALAFVLILSVLSAVPIFRYFRDNRKPEFAISQRLKTYSPREIVHRLEIQRRQKSSSRPQITPRMVALHSPDMALPEIKKDPGLARATFQPTVNLSGVSGFGPGTQDGLGPGKWGDGISEFIIKDIPIRGEKIVFLVDVSESMVEPGSGGVAGFQKVKIRVNEAIDSLKPGTLFNVVAFADAASAWKPEMVPATDVNKRQAKMWLQPFNAGEQNVGLTSGNIQPSKIGLPSDGGTTRLDLALTAAFENGADAILVIGDGIPRVRKVLSAQDLAEWNRIQDDWQRKHGAAHAAAVATAGSGSAGGDLRRERVWQEEYSRDSGKAIGGKWIWRNVPVGGGGSHRAPSAPPPPTLPEHFRWWTLADFVEHFQILNRELYEKIGKRPPTIHCIGYRVDRDGRDFLRALAEQYNGQYRSVSRM